MKAESSTRYCLVLSKYDQMWCSFSRSISEHFRRYEIRDIYSMPIYSIVIDPFFILFFFFLFR